MKIEDMTPISLAENAGAFDSVDELLRADPNQNQAQKSPNYPFWTADGRVVIDDEKLRQFLIENGFFRRQSSDTSPSRARNEPLETVLNEGGILKKYGEIALKDWVRKFIVKSEVPDDGILSKWLRYRTNDITDGLPIQSGNALRCGPDVCYIPFKNGVVVITKSSVELESYKQLQKIGTVLEDSLRERDIHLSNWPQIDFDKPIIKQVPSSPFTDFIAYAFKKGILPDETAPLRDNNPLWLGTHTPEWAEAVNGFETSAGYLIHQHHPSNPKAIIFVDGESMNSQKAKGGTGKSVSLKSLEHVRVWKFVDGRRLGMGGDRFWASGVTEDTQIVALGDINKEARFQDLYNVITDDMEIEGKGVDKKTIPRHLKPKIGITSNYLITANDTSSKRRQHIVSFGNFFNKVAEIETTNKSMSVEAMVGCCLFGPEMSDENWNDFYRYYILCTQKYLNKGLITPNNESYKKALLANEVGDDDVFEWMEDWVDNERIKGNFHINGIAQSAIYKAFSAYFGPDPVFLMRWEEKVFLDALFEYVTSREDVDWNPKQASKGDTRRFRRWLKGPSGNQEDWAKIVDK
jgi:hypothetical protein